MTNEELTVMDELIIEVKSLRRENASLRRNYNAIHEEQARTEKERDDEVEDNNRLREENANLHNQVTELTAERDDSRRKLFESARFINFTVYTALDAAVKSKRCRAIVKDTVDAMLHFQNKNPITFMEGGVAK